MSFLIFQWLLDVEGLGCLENTHRNHGRLPWSMYMGGWPALYTAPSSGPPHTACSICSGDHKAGGKSDGHRGFLQKHKIWDTEALHFGTFPPLPPRDGHSPPARFLSFLSLLPHPPLLAPMAPSEMSPLFLFSFMAAFDVHFNHIKICALWQGHWGRGNRRHSIICPRSWKHPRKDGLAFFQP